MKLKLLQVMAEREDWRVLDGRIEVNDAYLGGERPGKRGGVSANNVSFLVVLQTTDDGRPMLVRMNRIAFANDAIEAWADKALAASARVIADSLNCFTVFRDNVADYQAIAAGSGRQWEVTHPDFRRVNTVLSDLKAAISDTYHHFNFAKYADRYLAEVQYRFNRRFDLKSILVRLVRAATLIRPRPEPMIGLAEVGGQSSNVLQNHFDAPAISSSPRRQAAMESGVRNNG
jgi:hypothetical protein